MKQELDTFQLFCALGIGEGISVLDFGCGYGAYTIPVAKLTAQSGKVYALDRDREALDVLMKKALYAGLTNVVRLDADGAVAIELDDESIDAVIMFDVLHSFYFPLRIDRRIVLNEIHRILKPSATLCISIWPNLRDTDIEAEIADACFSLIGEVPERLTYDTTFSAIRLIQSYRKVSCAPIAVALANQSGVSWHG